MRYIQHLSLSIYWCTQMWNIWPNYEVLGVCVYVYFPFCVYQPLKSHRIRVNSRKIGHFIQINWNFYVRTHASFIFIYLMCVCAMKVHDSREPCVCSRLRHFNFTRANIFISMCFALCSSFVSVWLCRLPLSFSFVDSFSSCVSSFLFLSLLAFLPPPQPALSFSLAFPACPLSIPLTS